MEKKPMFFKDKGAMGDVLSQAKGLSKKVHILNDILDEQIKEVSEIKEQVEEERYSQGIKELLGKTVEGTKNKLSSLTSDWTKKKTKIEEKNEQLSSQQAEIQSQKQDLQNKQEEDPKQKQDLSKELETITKLEHSVNEKLAQLERTRESIDSILTGNQEKIRESILTREEVEFIKLKYFSLLRSRLATEGVTSPVSNNVYSEKDWKITLMESEIVAKTVKGMIKTHDDIYFDIIFSVPMDIEGFIYNKKGMEIIDSIKKFINSKDQKSYNTFVLACPTGWNDEIISHIKTMNNFNTSIYLVDLIEKQIFFNKNDEKTLKFAEWFAPITLDEEINDIVEKLNTDIKNGEMQFRIDKVVEKYEIPRKIVHLAFNKIAESGNAEIIDTDEGAKDIILLTR